MKKFLLIFLFPLSLLALEIDVDVLKDIIQKNPDSYKEKILLAKYYGDKDKNDKALALLEDALKKDPKNKDALKLKQTILQKQQNKTFLAKYTLYEPITKTDAQKVLNRLFDQKKYEEYEKVYTALVETQHTLLYTAHIDMAYIYLWTKRYALTDTVLSHVKQKNNIDLIKINAQSCFETKQYGCALSNYRELYRVEHSKYYAIKIIECYIKQGKIGKAETAYDKLHEKYPDSKDLIKIKDEIDGVKNSYFLEQKQAYEENKNIYTLEAYSSALFAAGKRNEAIAVVSEYNSHSFSSKSLLLEAKYLMWSGRYEESLRVLKNKMFDDNTEAKLLKGKIYSWNHQYDEAVEHLNAVVFETNNKEFVYEAKKAIAFLYKWQGDESKAKDLFIFLNKQKPSDMEVKKALMELNHDYAALIKLYKKRMKNSKTPIDLNYLSELYMGNKQPDKAIQKLNELLALHPNDLGTIKRLALLYIAKKEYYKGFGYLEYYTAKSGLEQDKFVLAQNYYWSGFTDEALEVINEILRKNPESQKALNLRAKILRVAPRFMKNQPKRQVVVKKKKEGVAKNQLEVANGLFLNKYYKSSLMYYAAYMQEHPTDYKARKNYALALEQSGKYEEAEAEFSLVLWHDTSDEVKYHYAYNMMKNSKLDEAKKIFLELQKSKKEALNDSLKEFLQSWKESWEAAEYPRYASHYAQGFRDNRAWALKKQALFGTSKNISLKIIDPYYKKEDNNTVKVNFYQEYSSSLISDQGYKTLTLWCEESLVDCEIVNEVWKKGKYNKAILSVLPIEQRLKEIEELQRNKETPKPQESKKKIDEPALEQNEVNSTTSVSEVSTEAEVTAEKKQPEEDKVYILINENHLGLNGYVFQDSSHITFASLTASYKRDNIVEDFDLAVDGGYFFIEQQNVKKYEGKSFGVRGNYKNFGLRLGVNRYADSMEFVPSIFYSLRLFDNSFSLEYTKQNALFYTYSLCPYEQSVTASHFSFSDYVDLYKGNDLWANITMNFYSNKDIQGVGQFDWRFFNEYLTRDFSYHLALEGWYTMHSLENSCFYSPKLVDTTLLRIDPVYPVSKNFVLKAKAALGHSFKVQKQQYKVGLWIATTKMTKPSFSFGCQASNVATVTYAPTYGATECTLDLGYTW